jgi:protein-S-isoprenylcysteine O-methyltransferase Ste14
MAWLALVVLVVWITLIAAVPSIRTYRRTGRVIRPTPVEPRSPAWWARVVSSLGIVLAIGAPVAELLGLGPIAALDHDLVRYGGLTIGIVAIAGVLGAQATMGESWRPDVDPLAPVTPLVTSGPFRIVRNPVLTANAAAALGYTLMVPNVIALLTLATIVTALQIQVRLVEEPYLERIHGDAYRRYAARTGRFLPGIGRRRSA